MRFSGIVAAWLGVAATTSAIGLHKAVDGLLQVTPSFTGDDILLHPGLHPDHDSHDLEHLVAGLDKVLHYSQEGHRPALHGAKHASLEARFIRNTVVLDQSDQVKSVTCDDNDMQICFHTPHALKIIEDSWLSQDGLNLVTYHVGCGDERSGKRSFFHASLPSINPVNMCIVVSVTPIEESDALDSGIMSWGTYTDPNERRRSPTKGHVRVNSPSRRARPTGPAVLNVTDPGASNATMDIAMNPWALETFFNNSHMDTSHMGEMIDPMNFVDMDDPEIPEAPTNMTRRSSRRSRSERAKRTMNEVSTRASSELSRRDIFTDLWNGLKNLGKRIGDFFNGAIKFIGKVGDAIVNLTVISAKLLLVPFGVPFDHSYHNDIKVHAYLEGVVGSRPPAIFGYKNGYMLAQSNRINDPNAFHWTVQCAKCGIHVNMDIDGRLAFSIKDGITEGKIQLANKDTLSLDAQFGINADGKVSKSSEPFKPKSKDLKSIPFAGLIIPGILTLGPQVTFGIALSLEAQARLELLVGGSVSIGPGTATANLKGKSGIDGFNPSFDPIFRAKGDFSITGEIGLPVALEVGLTVLEGKFKETVGLVNTPSIYVQAIASVDIKARDTVNKCDGVQLKVGAKNRIHVAAFDVEEFDIATIPLFEKDIGCVTVNGFDPQNEKSDSKVIGEVVKQVGDSSAAKPSIADATRNVKKVEGTQGFRILMDAEGDTILVTGTEGHLFLVGKDQGYDVSAPWGTLNTNANPLTLDVFGRVLSYKFLKPSRGVKGISKAAPMLADLMVSEPRSVPVGYRSTAIKELESAKSKKKTYGIPMVFEEPLLKGLKPMYYPTACKTPLGLVIIATREVITKEGKVKSVWLPDADFTQDMKTELYNHFGVYLKECKTIQLVSDR